MPSDKFNFKFEIRSLVFLIILSSILLLTNVTGWNKALYSNYNFIFDPLFVSSSNFSRNVKIFFLEISNKNNVLKENLDLRRSLLENEALEVENKTLLDEMRKLQSQVGINAPDDTKFKLVQIVGSRDIFSSNPEIIIRAGSKQGVNKNDIVYYEKNTMFGVVTEVWDRSSKVVPFYSSNLNFKIPVSSLKDPNQKGFISIGNDGSIQITNVGKEFSVNDGDLWITTNDVPEVPPNLIIGKIKSHKQDTPGNFQQIILEPPFSSISTDYLFIQE